MIAGHAIQWEQALEQIQQQGGQIDFRKLLETVSKLSNVDELRELVRFDQPIPGDLQQGGDGQVSFKPANTHRTYERINRPGGTRSGQDGILSRALMTGGLQEAEANAVGRGVS